MLLAELESSKLERKKLTDDMACQLTSFKKELGYKIDSNNFKFYNDYIGLVKNKIAFQEEIIAKNERKVESKRLELVKAIKETKMMDKLKENSFVEFLNEQSLQEQKDIDGIVSYRYNNR